MLSFSVVFGGSATFSVFLLLPSIFCGLVTACCPPSPMSSLALFSVSVSLFCVVSCCVDSVAGLSVVISADFVVDWLAVASGCLSGLFVAASVVG